MNTTARLIGGMQAKATDLGIDPDQYRLGEGKAAALWRSLPKF